MVKIRIWERPKRIQVERNGETHSARWRDRGGEGEVFDVDGDENLCRAALTAWSGEKEFEISDEELADRSGGWWWPS